MIYTYSLEFSSSINFVLYPASALCLPSVAPSTTAGTLSFCFLYRFLPSLSLYLFSFVLPSYYVYLGLSLTITYHHHHRLLFFFTIVTALAMPSNSC